MLTAIGRVCEVAGLIASSLAAVWLGFWKGTHAKQRVDEGSKDRTKSRRFRGDCSRVGIGFVRILWEG
jgi:hypothetical protein